MESVRYQDLVRWGDAKEVLGKQGAQIPSLTVNGVQWGFKNSTYGFRDRNKLLPIPLKETELNPNISQNEGWKWGEVKKQPASPCLQYGPFNCIKQPV